MAQITTGFKKLELTLEQRRERRRLRREKQRGANVHRAEKMHNARLQMEAVGKPARLSPAGSVYVGCSGWFYWKWCGLFYPTELPTVRWLSIMRESSTPSRSTRRFIRGR